MPSDFLMVDTSFPKLDDQQSTDEKFVIVIDYLYMLREYLQYKQYNLGVENFNSAELKSLTGMITEPIYARISDTEGNITALQVTAQGLSSRVQNAEGDISTLQQTATSLTSRISSTEGNVSTLQQTATSLTSRVSSVEGNVSTLQQTATSLTSRISSAEGNISTLQQSATSLTSRIGNAEGDITSLQQTVDSFDLTVSNGSGYSRLYLNANGVSISSARITFTGMVTFDDLETEGTTLIHGGNIDTDTLQVSDLYGRYVYLRDRYGDAQGVISVTPASTSSNAIDLTSYGALRLSAEDGNVYIEGSDGAYVQLSDEVILGGGDTRPNRTNYWTCGTSTALWSDVYAYNGTIVTSDLTKKSSVVYGLGAYDDFFDRLKPMSFLFNEGTSGRRHWGLGAQDVEQALTDSGLTGMDFAGFIKSPRKDEAGQVIEGEYDYALRPTELIPKCIEEIQRLKKRVKELEANV